MKRLITCDINEKRMLSLPEAVGYVSMGRNRGREFLEEIHATVRVGRRVLFDKQVIDQYFDQLAADQDNK